MRLKGLFYFDEALKKSAPWGANIKQIAGMYHKFVPDEYVLDIWGVESGNAPANGLSQATLGFNADGQLQSDLQGMKPDVGRPPVQPAVKVVRYIARRHNGALLSIVKKRP